jgi:hypothetical protein
MWGALPDERTVLSFTMYNIFIFYMLLHLYGTVTPVVFKITPRHGPRRKGNLVPEGITGPPYRWET